VNYSVVLTRRGETDIRETVDYISRILENRPAAERLLSQIEQRIETLSNYPEAHPLAADNHLREQGIRVFTTGNYAGLYRVRTDERKVVLLRFLYGRRDWQSLLINEDS